MIQVVVHDTSCLVDMRKGQLLRVLLRLPYRFIVPLPIRENELRHFTSRELQILDDGGMEVYNLSSEEIVEVANLMQEVPQLTPYDCMALITAFGQENSTLLTGDRLLRKTATERGVCVHGSFWVIDQLESGGICSDQLLANALKNWREDRTIYLPNSEIEKRLQRLSSR